MADRMAAEIHIGGKIPGSVAEELCGMIANEGAALDWGGGHFQPQTVDELLAACCDGSDGDKVLTLYDDDARWGEFEDLERFLVEHGIAFIRYSAGKYEYDAEIAAYDPKCGLVGTITDHSRNTIVHTSYLEPIARSLKRLLGSVRKGTCPAEKIERTLQRLHDRLRKHLTRIPILDAFEIVEG